MSVKSQRKPKKKAVSMVEFEELLVLRKIYQDTRKTYIAKLRELRARF